VDKDAEDRKKKEELDREQERVVKEYREKAAEKEKKKSKDKDKDKDKDKEDKDNKEKEKGKDSKDKKEKEEGEEGKNDEGKDQKVRCSLNALELEKRQANGDTRTRRPTKKYRGSTPCIGM
jgi:hypothetical protein